MAKAFKPQVLTANDLIEGDSVFLGPTGWGRDIAIATVAADPEALARLEAAGAEAETQNLIVGAYAVEVRLDGGVPVPVKRREQIRAARLPTFDYAPAPAAVARAA
ncbi:MAG: DUF2849 domain-containing protein [Paracoccaceae bacterium]